MQKENQSPMNESTAVTIYEKMDPLVAMDKLGEVFMRSGMFGADKLETAKVLALACIAKRRDPFELLQTYHIIHGRLTKRADAMLAEYRQAGGKCTWKSDLQNEKEAVAHFKYGENDAEYRYTIEDAKREELSGKGVWTKSTPDMLRARLVSKVLRMIAPEIVAGTYAPEDAVEPLPTARVSAELPPQRHPAFSKAPQASKPPIEVEAEIVPDPPEAPAEPEPPKAEEPPPVSGDYMDFAKAIKGHEELAYKWAVKKQWITDGQHKLSDIPADKLTKILKNIPGFLATIGATK